MRNTHRTLLDLCLAVAASGALGQACRAKPVRLVTVETGGGADLASRVIATGLTEALGQQVLVENRGGAGGAIAIEPSRDPLRDFVRVARATRGPGVLLVAAGEGRPHALVVGGTSPAPDPSCHMLHGHGRTCRARRFSARSEMARSPST